MSSSSSGRFRVYRVWRYTHRRRHVGGAPARQQHASGTQPVFAMPVISNQLNGVYRISVQSDEMNIELELSSIHERDDFSQSPPWRALRQFSRITHAEHGHRH